MAGLPALSGGSQWTDRESKIPGTPTTSAMSGASGGSLSSVRSMVTAAVAVALLVPLPSSALTLTE